LEENRERPRFQWVYCPTEIGYSVPVANVTNGSMAISLELTAFLLASEGLISVLAHYTVVTVGGWSI